MPKTGSSQSGNASGANPRIALLTPYSGANLGDGAIQDALIANIRTRLPRAEFSGITLNCKNFLERHGSGAFPLCATNRPFYGMSRSEIGVQGISNGQASQRSRVAFLRSVPALQRILRTARLCFVNIRNEIRHFVDGFRFLRTHDLLIVSGGGQLDDEWGGAWGHPYALFKWAMLAWIARVRLVVASVGAGKITSTTSRLFLSAALRSAAYRSFRNQNSRAIAARFHHRAETDPVVPDMALGVSCSSLPPLRSVRAIAQDRPVVAISLMAFAKPGSWPHANPPLYDRYIEEMARLTSKLLEGGYFLVFVSSSVGADKNVIPDTLGHLDQETRRKFISQIQIPAIATWKDLFSSLSDVDFLIASRLHSVILGFATRTPTVAISFDPKVDWAMEDLGQTDYLLQIRDFTADRVVEILRAIELRKDVIQEEIASYHRGISPAFEAQYDAIAQFASRNYAPSCG